MMRKLLLAVACTLLVAPPAFMATLLLHPLWSWVEAATGLESMGHHGPAGWCYLAVWALLALPLLLWAARAPRPGR